MWSWRARRTCMREATAPPNARPSESEHTEKELACQNDANDAYQQKGDATHCTPTRMTLSGVQSLRPFIRRGGHLGRGRAADGRMHECRLLRTWGRGWDLRPARWLGQ